MHFCLQAYAETCDVLHIRYLRNRCLHQLLNMWEITLRRRGRVLGTAPLRPLHAVKFSDRGGIQFIY